MECSDKCPMYIPFDTHIKCPFLEVAGRLTNCLYTAVHKFQMEREDESECAENGST